jgi:GTPase
MKFVDTVNIKVIGGKGGAGAVSFRREKYAPNGGPDGGKGGRGGNVVIEACSKLQTLMDLKIKKLYKASNGAAGKGKNQFGTQGQDLILKVPCGTIILDTKNNIIGDLVNLEETLIVAQGGAGGSGNKCFATSSNKAPRYAQPGLPGEEKELALELRLIAQLGIIGLPNAGKSTLLKKLTNASPKIANYPFTTLYPNLGVLRIFDQEIIIADIPGLIEGASHGLGLGHAFLRHVERTKYLIHLVALNDTEPKNIWADYNVVNKELQKNSLLSLIQKKQLVIFSKTDLVDKKMVTKTINFFQRKGIKAMAISALTSDNIDSLIQKIRTVVS